jgi:hypothetical protein
MTDRYDASLSTAERKRHGVFYTPEPVVRYLLRATAPVGPVADLSCGDGAFLAEAAAQGLPVMGIEQDPVALARAAGRLGAVHHHLHCGDGLTPDLPWVPDVVLGNPPYLEAKKTDPALKARCRRLFPDIARGGFDIFICFLKAGLDLLPPGGRLGYIVPNKMLVAEYARPLRELLLRETTIEEVIDVSDLPTFRDAAVYPVLLVVRKASPPPGHCVHTGQVTDLAQLETGDFPRAEIPQARWAATARSVCWLPPVDPVARGLVDRLTADPQATRLGDLLTLRWTISFHRAGLRDRFIFPAPLGRFPKKLLGGKRFHGNADVARYRLAWSGWWIDYDEARAKAEGNALPPAALFDSPKLLIAQNARRIVATLDAADSACKDTFILGRQRGDVPLAYLLGILNSALLSYLYGVLFKATHIGGGYLHYLAAYLEDLPIRLTDPAPLCALVERLLDPDLHEDDRRALDRAVDACVFDLYGLTAEERALVTAAIPAAWGEQGQRKGQWRAEAHAGVTPLPPSP